MPVVAASQGVAVDAIDAGGQHVFARPESAVLPRGPIAEVLAERVQASPAAVHIAARVIGDGGALSRVEADARAANASPSVLRETTGSDR